MPAIATVKLGVKSPFMMAAAFVCMYRQSNGPPETTCTNSSWSTPRPRASASVSAVAFVTATTQLLTTSLSREAAPAVVPSQMVFCPIASNTGCTHSRARSGPAAKMVSAPFSACLPGAEHRAVHDHQVGLAREPGQPLHPGRAHRAGLRPHLAGPQARRSPPHHILDDAGVGQHRHDDVGVPDRVGRRLGDHRPGPLECLGPGFRPVPHAQRQARPQHAVAIPVPMIPVPSSATLGF